VITEPLSRFGRRAARSAFQNRASLQDVSDKGRLETGTEQVRGRKKKRGNDHGVTAGDDGEKVTEER